jgi:hypothetical protein
MHLTKLAGKRGIMVASKNIGVTRCSKFFIGFKERNE